MILGNIDRYYRLHAPVYDLSRWSFLFGRNRIRNWLPVLPPNARILDLGCGTGKHLRDLSRSYPKSFITGLDRSESMLKQASKKSLRTNVRLRSTEYVMSSFESANLDLILASYSLSMMDRPESTIDIMYHHLRRSGYVLVVDFDESPFSAFKSWMHMNHVDLNAPLFDMLNIRFECVTTEQKHAYGGLYQYRLFLGRKT